MLAKVKDFCQMNVIFSRRFVYHVRTLHNQVLDGGARRGRFVYRSRNPLTRFAEKPGKRDLISNRTVITGLMINFRYAPGRKEMDVSTTPLLGVLDTNHHVSHVMMNVKEASAEHKMP
jgi:hypothetical protein